MYNESITRRKTMYDFEEVNAILNQMADENIVEQMVEPIDDPTVEVNFWDWAEVVGCVDDFVPVDFME